MRNRFPIAARFWLVLAVLVAAMAAMGTMALVGLGRLHDGADGLHQRLVTTAERGEGRFHLVDLRGGLSSYVTTESSAWRVTVRTRIDEDVARASSYVHETLSPEQVTAVETVIGLWRAGAFDGPRAVHSLRRAEALLDPVVEQTDVTAERELRDAGAARDAADAQYRQTRAEVLAAFLAALGLGVGMVLWLVRAVVPRTRDYSRFAARVADGDVAGRLAPRGHDELADLGRTLDEMVGRHETERAYQRTQYEFVDALQVSESEEEAHQLLKRHIERSVADSLVVVLNRNNSDDRLEPATTVDRGSPLASGLDGASPRSCLAVRFARRHEEGAAVDALLSCEVCGKSADQVTCDPLLVGGQVIGSVNVEHPAPLAPEEDKRLRDSVSQAAPVLANLRNLAIAELRAATDALTGLPNARATQDTLKRMVAQSQRMQRPLAAVLVDLDHFKQVNDTYGHGRGDEVLAAAAEAMRSAVRESDFVGRYGGEEFVLLLPDSDAAGAMRAAETVRLAVAAVEVPAVDRDITASFGVAVLGEDGIDGETVLRSADRALYAAKSLGRNRVAAAGAVPQSTPA